MKRRKYLKIAGGIGSLTLAAGCSNNSGSGGGVFTTTEESTTAGLTTTGESTTAKQTTEEQTTEEQTTEEQTTEEPTTEEQTFAEEIGGWPMPYFGGGKTGYNPNPDATFTTDGDIQWQTLTEEYTEITFYSPPLFHDDVLYMGTDRGVYAIEPSSPKTVWKRKINATFPLSKDENSLYVPSSDYDAETTTLYSLAEENGRVEWSKQFEGFIASLDLDRERIYFTNNEEARAVKKDSGEVEWKSDSYSLGWHAVGANRMYATTSSGIAAFEKETGDEIWHRDVAGGESDYCVVDGGEVFTITDKIYALNAENGDRKWTSGKLSGIDNDETSTNRPVVGPDRIVCGGVGTLHVFNRDNGKEVWNYEVENRAVPRISATGNRIYASFFDDENDDNDEEDIGVRILNINFDRTNPVVMGNPGNPMGEWVRAPTVADGWMFNVAGGKLSTRVN